MLNACINVTLLVAILNHPCFQLTEVRNDTHNQTILQGVAGREYQMLKVLSEKIGFRYKIVLPPKLSTGLCQPNGNCTGLLGMIAQQKADIAISRVTHTRERSKYVDFSYPYAMEEVTFATKEPDKVKVSNIFFFMEPFQIEIWIGIVGFLTLVILVIKILDRCSLFVPCDFDLSNLMMILLRQDVASKVLTRRAFNLIVLTTFIILSGCTAKIYECMITSSTSILPSSKPIDNLKDMVEAIEKRQFIVRARRGSSYYLYLLASRSGHMKILADNLRKNPFEGHPYNKESFSDILKNKITVVGPKIEMQAIVLKSNFSLAMFHFARTYLFLDPICVVFQKTFPCKTVFNLWLTIFMSSGLLSRWEANDLELAAQNASKEHAPQDSISYIVFSDLNFIFGGLVFGWILATFVCLSEIVTSRMKHKAIEMREKTNKHPAQEEPCETEEMASEQEKVVAIPNRKINTLMVKQVAKPKDYLSDSR